MDQALATKLNDFFETYPERRIAKGTTVIDAYEDPPGVIQLLAGTVAQYDISKQGQRVVVNVFRPPAFFPMSWAINKTPNTYFFEALNPVRCRIAPPDKVVAFLQQNPDVLLNLLGRVYRGTDGLLARMAYLMSSDARTRLLFELLTVCRRSGRAQPNQAWTIDVTETDLAAYTGLSRETVSRLLQKLSAEGLVSLQRAQITIPHIDDLEAALGMK